MRMLTAEKLTYVGRSVQTMTGEAKLLPPEHDIGLSCTTDLDVESTVP